MQPKLGDRLRFSPHRGCFTGEITAVTDELRDGQVVDQIIQVDYFYKVYEFRVSQIDEDSVPGQGTNYWLLKAKAEPISLRPNGVASGQ